MEKIIIDAGCENGHTSKQSQLLNFIREKVKELYPDAVTTGDHTGCWSRTCVEHEDVRLTFSVDSSD